VTSTPAGPPSSRYRWTILAAGVVAQAAFSAILLGLPSIAPAIQHHYALSLTQVGVVLAAVNFGSIATLLTWGLVADRIGERAVIAIGQLGAAGALVWAGYARSLGVLVAALALAGAVGAGVNAASGRAVMSWFAADERGLALGIRQMAVPLGGAIAAGALPALDTHIGLRAAFVGLAAGCVAASLVGATFIRAEATTADHAQLAQPLSDTRVWRICVASTFYVTTQIALIGFVVLFLHNRRGVSTAAAAGALAATQVLGGVARIAVGRWSDRMHARIVPLRAVALGLAITAGAVTALLDASIWIVIPALVVAGTFALSWNGLSFTATAETAGSARSGAAIGLQQTFLAGGSIVAPIAFGAIVHHGSWRTAFALAALSPLVGYALLSPLAEHTGASVRKVPGPFKRAWHVFMARRP
jgi:sugar phosphate permease